MEKKDNVLEEPAASYGRKIRLSDVAPQPMENMEERLRAMGYISHEEFVEHLSKYL